MMAKLKQRVTEPVRFAGFPEDGFRLLEQLKKHNEREWFRERKAKYQELVEQPMAALVHAVAKECQGHGLPLHAKEPQAVMRVYRDIRFSKDKTPFKTHVAAELRRSFSGSSVMLYLHFDPRQPFVAAGVWQPDRPLLHTWRESIGERPERFEKMVSGLARKRLKLEQQYSLAKMPRGFQNYAEESFGPALRLTSFVIDRKFTRSECTNARVVKQVVSFALAARPLLEYGWGVEERLAEKGTANPRH